MPEVTPPLKSALEGVTTLKLLVYSNYPKSIRPHIFSLCEASEYPVRCFHPWESINYQVSWGWDSNDVLLNGWTLLVFLTFQKTVGGMEDIQPEIWEMYSSGYFNSKWFKKHSSLSVFSRLVEMFQDLIVSHLLFGHSFHIFSPGLTMAGTTATEAGHQGFNFVANTGCGYLCIV